MQESFEMTVYAVLVPLKNGGMRWLQGFDSAGKPTWLEDPNGDKFKEAKHYVGTKEAWVDADKAKAAFDKPCVMKVRSQPCKVTLEITEVFSDKFADGRRADN